MADFDRPALVQFAQDSISRGSKSFRFASRLFDRITRERVWLLYAWCRKCDDMADGQDHGGAMAAVTDPQESLAAIRTLTAAALAGMPTGEPAFDCLGVVARECGITARMAEDVIEGFALDAADWHPRRESDLYQYCYHVAGAVGVMMAVVMGVPADDDATLDRACDLGLAFQLANIARDIVDDARVGRVYLPSDWLEQEGLAGADLANPKHRPALARLGRLRALVALAHFEGVAVNTRTGERVASGCVPSATGSPGPTTLLRSATPAPPSISKSLKPCWKLFTPSVRA